jgi:hypothetical protein
MATVDPRTMLHSTDLDGEDFALKDGKIVLKQGLAGPFELTEGTISSYENQSGKPELVWYGGTETEPSCSWIVYPDDTSVKIKWPSPSEFGFCQAAVDCTIADLERGGGTDDKYIISSLTGAPWEIVEVLYGDGLEAQFSADSGDSLIALMGALNDSENLPDGWLFSIASGYLVLTVPYGTDVTAIELGSGVITTFTAPSVSGSPGSQLAAPMALSLAGPMDVVIAQYEALLSSYAGALANAFGVGTATTEAAIQTEFTANSKIEVRWTDSDGDKRISYKDPVNGWYHPVTKSVPSIQVYSSSTPGVGGSPWTIGLTGQSIDVTTGVVPADAKFVNIEVDAIIVAATTGSGTSRIAGNVNGKNGGIRFSLQATGTELGSSGDRATYATARVAVKSGGIVSLTLNANSVVNHIALIFIYVTGWER